MERNNHSFRYERRAFEPITATHKDSSVFSSHLKSNVLGITRKEIKNIRVYKQASINTANAMYSSGSLFKKNNETEKFQRMTNTEAIPHLWATKRYFNMYQC